MGTSVDWSGSQVGPPPRHAWDWFARQRLLWRGVRRELAAMEDPIGHRYGMVDSRNDVIACLRADYPVDADVRAVVHRGIDRDVFLGHAHRGLAGLGIHNAPRGLRWWWAAVTDNPAPGPGNAAPGRPARRQQLALDITDEAIQESIEDVRTGWGD